MAFPGSPRLLKGGIVLLDAQSAGVRKVIPLQYNPDSLSRTLQAQAVGGEGGERSEALRLKGPPVETIRVEAEMDATDAEALKDPTVGRLGLLPMLAALETIVYPESQSLVRNDALAAAGALEIIPAEGPLTLFVWSQSRVVPVRITEFSVTEEAFDANLHPIRARLSLGLRVLSVADLGFRHRGGSLFLAYQQQKERLAALSVTRGLDILGLGGLP